MDVIVGCQAAPQAFRCVEGAVVGDEHRLKGIQVVLPVAGGIFKTHNVQGGGQAVSQGAVGGDDGNGAQAPFRRKPGTGV